MTAYDTRGLDTAPARVTPFLLGLVGERFATAASAIQAGLRSGGDGAAERARAGLGELERIGVQLQQVARMVAHEGLAPTEEVDLMVACQQAVAGWQTRADAAGVRLVVAGAPVKADLNASALEQTLDLLVEHAVAVAEQLRIDVASAGAPAPASIRFDITRRSDDSASASSTPSDADELLPMLASLLARHSGLLVRHTRMGRLSTLILSVVAPAPDVTDPETEAMIPRTPIAVGVRILIVDPRATSRLKAHQLLHKAGMKVDAVESVPQAQAALRDGDPDILITGYSVIDLAVADLIDQIRSGYPSLRVIELVDQDNAFAFSLPGADAPGRLSRNELDDHLVAAVSQEILASRPG